MTPDPIEASMNALNEAVAEQVKAAEDYRADLVSAEHVVRAVEKVNRLRKAYNNACVRYSGEGI
jgi:hypothetical protein